jgi:hypothetical protein
MWIIQNDAFLSIVQDRNEPKNLYVRARIAGDIETVFPDLQEGKVEFNTGTDYAYRVSLPREDVYEAIARDVHNIDYTNFKNSVEDEPRHDAYLDIWSIMFKYQQEANPIPIKMIQYDYSNMGHWDNMPSSVYESEAEYSKWWDEQFKNLL